MSLLFDVNIYNAVILIFLLDKQSMAGELIDAMAGGDMTDLYNDGTFSTLDPHFLGNCSQATIDGINKIQCVLLLQPYKVTMENGFMTMFSVISANGKVTCYRYTAEVDVDTVVEVIDQPDVSCMLIFP